MKQLLTTIIRMFLVPADTDLASRQFILRVLLIGLLALSVVGLIYTSIMSVLQQSTQGALPPFVLVIICGFLLGLYLLSFRNHGVWSALIIVVLVYFASLRDAITWGTDLPQSILMFALVIVMSGILINTKFAVFMTVIICGSMAYVSYSHLQGLLPVNTDWKSIPYTWGDVIIRTITLFIIALLSWLFNWQIERAFRRVRVSEEALRKHNEDLEFIIDKRTQQIQQLQLEKTAQLYRFAEFGKLSSGFFHEFSNSLNIVSMELKQLKHKNIDRLTDIKAMISRAEVGTKQMEDFIIAAGKHLNDQVVDESFSVRKEILQAIKIMSYKARKAHVKIVFHSSLKIKLQGNPLKFHQLISNLLSNAIDSYHQSKKPNKVVTVTLEVVAKQLKVMVSDNGTGIHQDIVPHIFKAFFTTKHYKRGSGLGLSITHSIVTQDFKGTIHVESKKGKGSTFIVLLPIPSS